MAEVKKIIHIENSDLNNLTARQIGVQVNVDSDLNFRAWGGKDGQGNVSLWLAKDERARVTDLTISNISGTAGILQHDASGVVSGDASISALTDVLVSSPTDGQVLIYDLANTRWENATISTAPSLDDSYNNDTGERLIEVDDGSVRWEIDASTMDFIVDLTDNVSSGYGFYVQDAANAYFCVKRHDVGEGTWRLEVESNPGAGTLNWDVDCNSFLLDATGTLNLTCTNILYLQGSSDIRFTARSTSIYLSETGNAGFDVSFVNDSIVGCINELKTDIGNVTLDDCYNADTGERTITVDDGDVRWSIPAATTYTFEVYQIGTGSTTTNTIMRIQADGTLWGTGSKCLEIVTDDDDAIPLSLVNGVTTNEIVHFTRDAGIVFYYTGYIETNNGGDLTLAPDAAVRVNGDIYLGNTTSTCILPTMTTTQRNSLSTINGRMIYNSSTSTIQAYNNGFWQDIGDIT